MGFWNRRAKQPATAPATTDDDDEYELPRADPSVTAEFVRLLQERHHAKLVDDSNDVQDWELSRDETQQLGLSLVSGDGVFLRWSTAEAASWHDPIPEEVTDAQGDSDAADVEDAAAADEDSFPYPFASWRQAGDGTRFETWLEADPGLVAACTPLIDRLDRALVVNVDISPTSVELQLGRSLRAFSAAQVLEDVEAVVGAGRALFEVSQGEVQRQQSAARP
jgi:hypothetical protein